MNSIYKLLLILPLSFSTSVLPLAPKAPVTKYKCMVQMTNYVGEGAYIVLSLVDSKGVYEKTLYMMGPDKKWYTELKEWNKFQKQKPANISAITGASVAGGDRSVVMLEIDDSKINKGYTLRFETAVEDKKYYTKDLEVPLTTEGIATKTEGTGYIRYVRLIAN